MSANLVVEVTAEGECGTNVGWILDNEGTLTIYGAVATYFLRSATGIMDDYASAEDAPWYPYRSQIKEIVVEESVPNIGNNAFACCEKVTEVTIGSDVSDIGSNAFSGCAELKQITFLGSAPTIEQDTFTDVTTTVTYPANDESWTDEVKQDYAGDITWAPAVEGEITDNGRTLSLDGVVFINQYVRISGFEDVDPATDGGLLIWTTPVTDEEAILENADKVVEGLKKVGNEYAQQTYGIAAKEHADILYLRVYVKQQDGTYVYSPLKEYSVRHYCESRIEKGKDSDLKKTCIDMLHYGAAAQAYFNYNTADPANKNIVETNPSTAWDANMLTPVTDFTTNITASSNVRSNGKTLSLDGAVSINYYFKVNGIEVAEAEMLVWDGITEELTVDNVSYTKQLIAGGGEYGGQSNPFAAKEYSKTIYTCAHFVDSEGNDHYSEIVAYSPEAYAASRIEKSTDAKMVTMMKQMVIYGESAYICFN